MSIQLSPVPPPPPPRAPSPDVVVMVDQNHDQDEDQERGQDHDAGHLVPVLPPTDGGAGAWKYLAGCFLVEGLLWGFPLAFGVFQEHYARQPEFAGDDGSIAAIGTVATSIYFLGAPIAAPLVRRFQWWQRYMLATGWGLCALSLLAASAVGSVGGLVATQGVLYGLGFLMLYFPVLGMLNEWFVHRRGLAYGVLYAGGGVAGAALPFALERLLALHGHRVTLRAVALAQLAGLVPGLLLLRPRLPPAGTAALRAVDVAFLRRPLFWAFAASNFCQGLGYFIPSLWLPTFATTGMGLSGSAGALLLAVNNLACVVGQLAFGHLTDRRGISIHVLVSATTFVAGVATLTLWGLARSPATLLAFSGVYGAFAGAYIVFWPKFGSLLSEDPQTVYSLMAFGKGIGNVVTGPVSAGLVRGQVTPGGYGLGRFGGLVVFVGSLMLLSSLEGVWLPARHLMTRRGGLRFG
ncbi:hypothetical protein JDV02_005495 [Purpureocillium takamizusanense]|uniref:Uncharacterized protein n=1 Tax=Purpureocillium takamizusanense TaxID=2060973 RepID=A0A9Q8QGL8_9HYPO|nr:uncharacterized protein JDV02_005495 [Purpureocillium takamizusanense]UNI19303.1 hypothetical protein JDV02_005495 [Purpureocillium takamizusanense]